MVVGAAVVVGAEQDYAVALPFAARNQVGDTESCSARNQHGSDMRFDGPAGLDQALLDQGARRFSTGCARNPLADRHQCFEICERAFAVEANGLSGREQERGGRRRGPRRAARPAQIEAQVSGASIPGRAPGQEGQPARTRTSP